MGVPVPPPQAMADVWNKAEILHEMDILSV